MIEKIKALFDSRITWTAIGGAVGTLFGDQAASIAAAVGSVVMAVL